MPPKKASTVAPVARPSRARAAKTATKEAVAKAAATAKSTIKKLSPKPSSKATSSKATSSKATSSQATASTATASKSAAKSTTINKSTALNSNQPSSSNTTKSTATTTTAAATKKPAVKSNTGKVANISRKRSLQYDDDEDQENEPPSKKAKGKAVAKPKTAAAKLLETKAKMTAKKTAPTKAARAKAATAKATSSKAAPAPKKTAKRKAASHDEDDGPASKKIARASEGSEDSPVPEDANTAGVNNDDTEDSWALDYDHASMNRKIAPLKKTTNTVGVKNDDTEDDDSTLSPVPEDFSVLYHASMNRKIAPLKKTTNTAGVKNDDTEDEDSWVSYPASMNREIAPLEKTAVPKPVIDPVMKVKIGVQIKFAPTAPLDIFVFGEGSAGELGLGARKINGKSPIDVKRPRKNPLLSAPEVGVVQLACGGMHGLALTKNNKILSWGVNDQGALGRNTDWDGGLRDADAPGSGSDSDSEDDSGLNPCESTPAEVDMSGVAPGTKFVQVAASDSCSLALTEDGRVYAWGTFRGGDGILGFSPTVNIQKKPCLVPDIKKIVAIATGSNHVLVLDNKGKIYTWGAPEQNQLGRRVVERDIKASALRAGGLAFKRGTHITKIAAGSYHSFALDDRGQVWSWGLNNHGQLGHSASVDDDDAFKLEPTLVEELLDHRVIEIIGGEHHSMVITDEGKALVFGRIDTQALGIEPERFNEDNTLYDSDGKACILAVPTELAGLPKIVTGDSGTESSYVVTESGHAYSWGFNTNFQCGIGITEGEVLTPTLMDNSVVKDRKIIFAGAGGQYGMLAAVQVQEE